MLCVRERAAGIIAIAPSVQLLGLLGINWPHVGESPREMTDLSNAGIDGAVYRVCIREGYMYARVKRALIEICSGIACTSRKR